MTTDTIDTPETPPAFVPDAVNLDAMSPDDLLAFVAAADASAAGCRAADQQAHDAVVALCGAAPNGAPRLGVLLSLQVYARAKRRAMLARLAGRIEHASSIETRLDNLYTNEIANTKAAW